MKIPQPFWSFLILVTMGSCTFRDSGDIYSGTAYSDPENGVSQQSVPGKLQCEFYDRGGEGVAFHDADSSNNGSGRLNAGAGYLNTFRMDEAVDISYTKFHDSIDNSIYNLVRPKQGQLYVGWTEPGEWIQYTVDVKTAGVYLVGMMYTAHDDGQISISVNGLDLTGPIDIPSTYVDADPLGWRQWHHWNYMENMAEIELKKGLQRFTLHTVANGQMNYDFLSFTLRGSL